MYRRTVELSNLLQFLAVHACSLDEAVAVCTLGNSRIVLMSADGNAVERAVILGYKIMLTL